MKMSQVTTNRSDCLLHVLRNRADLVCSRASVVLQKTEVRYDQDLTNRGSPSKSDSGWWSGHLLVLASCSRGHRRPSDVSLDYCDPGNFRKRLIFVLFVVSWNL